MNRWRLGAAGIALAALAGSCVARGPAQEYKPRRSSTPVVEVLDQPPARCSLSDEVCDIIPVYDDDDDDRLILSANGLDATFAAGATITTGAYITLRGSNGISEAGGSTLMVAGHELAMDAPTRRASQAVAYCTIPGTAPHGLNRGVRSDCFGDDHFAATPVGYDYYFRYPAVLHNRDHDIVMARYILLKTARSKDYVVFGAAATLSFVSELPDPSTSGRYRPHQTGAFVSGPRFDAGNALPQTGYAAYTGFANAYAEISNRNFLPFHPGEVVSTRPEPELRDRHAHEGSYFGQGHSAMVFSFDGSGARFEHGYIDLFGGAFTDNGDSEQTDTRYGVDLNGIILSLDGRFANPEYLDEAFATARSSVVASRFRRVADYEANPLREVDLDSNGPNYQDSITLPGNSVIRLNAPDIDLTTSGLAFRLTSNVDTSERLDFTMELVSLSLAPGRTPTDQSPSCYVPNPNVVCYVSTASPTGAGLLRLYGGPANDLTLNTDANGAPFLAAGVWQYQQIVYVDTGDDGPGGSNDRLLGVVDLVGSLGGLIYDAEPD